MRFTKFGGTLHPADDEAMNWLLQANEGADLECKAISNRRTAQQNRAIHAFLTELANNLNAAGFDLLTFPWKEGVEIPWNLDLAKDRLWRPIQEVVTDKKHTADLTTDEVDKVYQPHGDQFIDRIAYRCTTNLHGSREITLRSYLLPRLERAFIDQFSYLLKDLIRNSFGFYWF